MQAFLDDQLSRAELDRLSLRDRGPDDRLGHVLKQSGLAKKTDIVELSEFVGGHTFSMVRGGANDFLRKWQRIRVL